MSNAQGGDVNGNSDILEKLRQDIPRWQAELENPANVRTTMFAGIAQQCCAALEILFEGCAQYISQHAGESNRAEIMKIGVFKPRAKFTMGENIHVIRKFHDVAEENLRLNKVLYPADVHWSLSSIVKLRNDIQHPTRELARKPELLSGMTLQLLESAAVFCGSELVRRATAADNRGTEHVG